MKLGIFTPMDLAKNTGLDLSVVVECMERLRDRNIIKQAGSRWTHVPATSPGRAAVLDQQRKPKESPSGTSVPVAGTGSNSPLAKALKRASADVKGVIQQVVNKHGEGAIAITKEGHFIISACGQRIIIAPKPNRSGFVKDLARLRRHGIITA